MINACGLKDSINIYCAVPQSWPDWATLPDDYYKNAFLTIDDLWKINTETGEKNLVLQGIGDISNLDMNSNNNSLIFISRNSRFLYQLKLIIKVPHVRGHLHFKFIIEVFLLINIFHHYSSLFALASAFGFYIRMRRELNMNNSSIIGRHSF